MSTVVVRTPRGIVVQSGREPMRDADQAEIRLMGLILTQAVSIGIAIAVFDAEYWLKLDDPTVNGITYAMAAFAVQGVAYYLFKMFFQQGMDERARIAAQEKQRRTRYRSMEMSFDRRRQDMEIRMQEAQLEAELNWMEQNPGQTPPWIEQRMMGTGTGTTDFVPKSSAPLSLGFDFDNEKKPAERLRGADGKYKSKDK
tara:strand:+ start:692 stop:1288 length:597 start_codon:yes stop_codon:yes gene_type:complete